MNYNMDDFISDSKELFDKLTVKANGAVNVSKAYIEKAQLRVKLREKYYALGKTCYEMHRDGTDTTGNMKMLIKEIKMLEAQLEYAEEASGKPKICKLCGAKNSSDNSYCAKCGEKLS
ncbi:MAG: hypothetical protein MSJ26_04005 [Oscillospiraceae bacterium]|nr:hypothetical protein [Oscillospiraceae bacterium]